MKIEALHLMAFGPFTDRTLDFSAAGLHVIFGRNEAGKSSALRAIDSLLFGIPTQTGDNFLHPYDQLRIGATLTNDQGERVAFARRKKRKPFVSLDETEKVLADNLLDNYLHGLEQKRFRDIHCIDHIELRRGGELMRELKGLAGDSLLVASTSSDLPRIQLQLQEEIDALFVSRGRKSKIKQGISEYQAAKKEKSEHEVRVSRWTQLQTALDEQERNKFDLREVTKNLRADQSRLERLRDALTKIAEWKRVNEELSGQKVQILPDDYSIQQRQQCETELKSIDSRIAELEDEVQVNRDKLEQITESPQLLAEAAAIEVLQQRIGTQLKAREERNRAMAEMETTKREIDRLLGEIDADVPFDKIEQLRLSREHRAALFELAETERSVREKPRSLTKERESNEKQMEKFRVQSEQLGKSVDTQSLERVLRQVAQLGDGEEELTSLRHEHSALQQKTDRSLAALPNWDGSLQQLASAKLPLRETVEQHAQATIRLAEKIDSIRNRLQDASRDQERLVQEIEAATRASGIVTEDDLQLARELRDASWNKIERACRQDLEIDQDEQKQLLETFTLQLAKTDEIADRLRREADRVAELAQREAQSTTLQKLIDKLSAELADLNAQEAELQSQWQQVWQAGRVTNPQSAKEMAAWLEQRDKLIDAAEDLLSRERQIARLSESLQSATIGLSDELQKLELDVREGAFSLRDMISHAHTFIDDERTKNSMREQLQKDLSRLAEGLENAQREESAAAKELEQWQQDWSTAMTWIACDANATSALARARVECLDEISQRHEQWLRQHQRIQDIDADEKTFAAEVYAIAQRAEIDVADWAPIETAGRLKSWLDEAKSEDQAAKTLRDAIDGAEQKVCELRMSQKQNAAQLAQFLSLAGVDSNDNLPHIESLSDRALVRRKLRDEIQRMSGGRDFAQFVADAEDRDIDELGASLRQLEEEIQEKEDQTDLVVARITEITNEMDAIDGNAAFAEADQRAMNCLASVHEMSRRYTRLRIAQSLLRQHIERYQEENRDPLLAKASEYFAAMTCDEFLGLQVDYDDNNRPIIQGIRRNRKLVDVTAMSDGTRDPMFLALRLAYIQKRLGHHESMPFIVDDILIHLDDHRATATLRVLAELSHQMQVLFFTHHDRLRELAERNLSSDRLTVHDLEKTDVELATSPRRPK